jgi:hypothetical protein
MDEIVPIPTGPLWEMACDAAGCTGNVQIDVTTGQIELRDGSDIVLWSAPLTIRQKPVYPRSPTTGYSDEP